MNSKCSIGTKQLRRKSVKFVSKRLKKINQQCDNNSAADDNALNADFNMFPLNNDGDSNNDAEAETTSCANAEENVDNSVCENLCDDVYFDYDSVPRYDSSAGLYNIRDYESSSDSSDDETISFNLQNALANIAVQFSITLCALSALLLILHVFHPELPKDASTI